MERPMTTIHDIRRNCLWLLIRCKACGRTKYIPAEFVPARLKDELPARLAAAYFRCEGCGSKDLASRVANPAKDHGLFQKMGDP